MRVHDLHPWDVGPADARAIRARLAPRVSREDAVALNGVRTVAGVDNSYVKRGGETIAHAAVVVLSVSELAPIVTAVASRPVAFQYDPGFLSYREAPAVLPACAEVRSEPDVLLFEIQGYVHPRRFGLASLLALGLDRPWIGCAKSRLVGAFEEPERAFGAASRTRPRRAPLVVSPGHALPAETAVALVLVCGRDGAFLAGPARLAPELVTAARGG